MKNSGPLPKSAFSGLSSKTASALGRSGNGSGSGRKSGGRAKVVEKVPTIKGESTGGGKAVPATSKSSANGHEGKSAGKETTANSKGKTGPVMGGEEPLPKVVKAGEERKLTDRPFDPTMKKASMIGKPVSHSPPSTITRHHQRGRSTSHLATSLSISALTDSSFVGKVPTLVVNPSDIPTTRTITSDKSWSNVTVGGRRAPSAAQKKDQIVKQRKRTRKAILISTLASFVALIVILVILLSSWFALSLPNPTSSPAAGRRSTPASVT